MLLAVAISSTGSGVLITTALLIFPVFYLQENLISPSLLG